MTFDKAAREAAKEIDSMWEAHSNNRVRPMPDTASIITRHMTSAIADSEWRPMDTAPKDGTEVLLTVKSRAGISHKCLVGHWMPGGHCIGDHPPIDRGWYFWNGCMFDLASKPIAWMPLPDPAAGVLAAKGASDGR